MNNSRIDVLREELKRLNLDALVVTTKENIFYLSGINFPGFLIVTLYESIFFTLDRYVKEAFDLLNIYSGIVVRSKEKDLEILEDLLEENSKVGVEIKSLTLKELDIFKRIFKTEIIETENIIEKIREVKEEDEIEKIQEIGAKLEHIMEIAYRMIEPHVSEIDIRERIIEELERRNLKPENIRVVSGENTADKYYKGGFRRFSKDDIVIIDILASLDGYKASLARTFFLGDPSVKYDEIKEIYEKIYHVEDTMLKNIRRCSNISELQKEIQNELEKINWNTNYFTATGIGIEEVEEPIFKIGNYSHIKKNMVIKLEPQIYFPEKFGILIKDTIKVTDANFVFLATYKKTMLDEIIIKPY